MKPTYRINHKAAMDSAFRPAKGEEACYLCRNAKGPAKPREAFTCTKGLPVDTPACPSFRDARRPTTEPPDFLK